MTNGEIQAVLTADKYYINILISDKLKKLGEEYIEFFEAAMFMHEVNIFDEAADICFLILHILSIRIKKNKAEINLKLLSEKHKPPGDIVVIEKLKLLHKEYLMFLFHVKQNNEQGMLDTAGAMCCIIASILKTKIFTRKEYDFTTLVLHAADKAEYRFAKK